MTSPGVCSCGEQLPPTSGPSHVCKRPVLLDIGGWTHEVWQGVATPQTRPYRCPVCEGHGHVPAGFYTGGAATGTNPTEVTVGQVIVFHHEPSDGWWAESPARPGCYAAGETLEECARLWAESVELWGKR